jgi:hypothetical protein
MRSVGGKGMGRILIITLSLCMLASCAGGHDKSAGINDCKRAASAERPVYHGDIGISSSVQSSFDGIPGRDIPNGRSELLPSGTSANSCVHNEDKPGKPLTTDLQKIGAALPSANEARPV